MLKKIIISAAALIIASADFSYAQVSPKRIDLGSMSKRLDKLERELRIVNRQAARLKTGETSSEILVDDEYEQLKYSNAAMSVRLDEIEESVRTVRGKIEEIEFVTNKNFKTLSAEIKKLNGRVVDFDQQFEANARSLTDLKNRKPVLAVPDAEFSAEEEASSEPAQQEEVSNTQNSDVAVVGAVKLYNRALKALRESEYETAKKDLDYFIQAHDNHKLIGNAYYWLGETYFVDGDFVMAADKFRQGFEADNKGLKAAANLFKLGVSLSRQQKDAQACVVLKQVEKKFPKEDRKFQRRVASEISKIGCKQAG